MRMRRPRRRSQLAVQLDVRPRILPRRARSLCGAAMIIPRFLPIPRRRPTRQLAVQLAVQLAIRRCILPRRPSHRREAAMGTRRRRRCFLPLALSGREMDTSASKTGDLRSSVFPDRTRVGAHQAGADPPRPSRPSMSGIQHRKVLVPLASSVARRASPAVAVREASPAEETQARPENPVVVAAETERLESPAAVSYRKTSRPVAASYDKTARADVP